MYVPSDFIEKVDKDIINFAWDNKPPKIKTTTMISNIDKGGLRLPKFSIMVQS